jgi:hypothetical protein
MTLQLFPEVPTQRLMDTLLPDLNVAKITNPVLEVLPQLPGMGWASCAPQHRNLKLRQAFGGAENTVLLEHIAHAKRFIQEHIKAYVDGFLPTILRKIKYAIDKVKIVKYFFQLLATLSYLENLIRQEIAMALNWANRNIAVLNYLATQITPGALATAAEQTLRTTRERVQADIAQQITENGQMLSCLV